MQFKLKIILTQTARLLLLNLRNIYSNIHYFHTIQEINKSWRIQGSVDILLMGNAAIYLPKVLRLQLGLEATVYVAYMQTYMG